MSIKVDFTKYLDRVTLDRIMQLGLNHPSHPNLFLEALNFKDLEDLLNVHG